MSPSPTDLLLLAAEALGELRQEVVFVGGATIHLWLTSPGAPPTRATDDVDVVCDVVNRSDYYQLVARLNEHGFLEASDSTVLCRFRHRDSGLVLDVMPTDESILGFSNRWYRYVIERAAPFPIGDFTIMVAPPEGILATKLDAWLGRGRGDVLTSLDLHDIVVLVDGRPELLDEVATAPSELEQAVRAGVSALLQERYFDYVIESAVSGYGRTVIRDRANLVRVRLQRLANSP